MTIAKFWNKNELSQGTTQKQDKKLAMPLTWLVRWDTFSFLRRQISRFLSSSHEDRRYGSLRDWRTLIPPLTYLCILCCLDYSIKFLIIQKAKYQYPPSSTVKLLPVQNFNSLKLFMLFDCPQLHYDAQKFKFFYLTQSKTPSFFKNSRYVSWISQG